MTDPEIYALENRHPTMHGIDSEANGLKYILCDEEKGRVAVAGQLGITALTLWQLVCLCREAPGILQVHFGVDVETYHKNKQVKK